MGVCGYGSMCVFVGMRLSEYVGMSVLLYKIWLRRSKLNFQNVGGQRCKFTKV